MKKTQLTKRPLVLSTEIVRSQLAGVAGGEKAYTCAATLCASCGYASWVKQCPA